LKPVEKRGLVPVNADHSRNRKHPLCLPPFFDQPFTPSLYDDIMIKNMTRHSVDEHLKKVVRLTKLMATHHDRDVEGIHALRTATRRANVALELFGNWLPTQRTERISRRLKKLRRRAGSVRDLHIIESAVRNHFAASPDDIQDWLMAQIDTSGVQQSKSLRKHCRQLMQKRFKHRARSLAKRVKWRGDGTEPGLAEFCRTTFDHLFDGFFKLVDLLKSNESQLHPVRIFGRRLRYTLEMMSGIVADSLREEAGKLLSEIQDTLGSARDQITTLDYLKQLPPQSDETAKSIEKLIHQFEQKFVGQQHQLIHDAIEKAEQLRELQKRMTF
jgi:CHAD domain-containing protein